jgi:hypothetical protein
MAQYIYRQKARQPDIETEGQNELRPEHTIKVNGTFEPMTIEQHNYHCTVQISPFNAELWGFKKPNTRNPVKNSIHLKIISHLLHRLSINSVL